MVECKSIVRKVNLKLSIMSQVKGLSRQCLDVLYKLHVRSSIDYAIVVFGPSLNVQQLRKLDSLNYRAARLVTGALKFTNSVKLLNGRVPPKELNTYLYVFSIKLLINKPHCVYKIVCHLF